jgi:HEPN domain-containing protein
VIIISSLNTVNKLLKKAAMFLKSAKANYKKGLYDVACFEADQAVQLFVKAHVLKLSGSVPRTHGLRALLGYLASAPNVNPEAIREFVAKNRSNLIMLEDAYIRSRYLGEEYNKEDTKRCLEIAEKVFELVRYAVASAET